MTKIQLLYDDYRTFTREHRKEISLVGMVACVGMIIYISRK
jgi:hypothetical protein